MNLNSVVLPPLPKLPSASGGASPGHGADRKGRAQPVSTTRPQLKLSGARVAVRQPTGRLRAAPMGGHRSVAVRLSTDGADKSAKKGWLQSVLGGVGKRFQAKPGLLKEVQADLDCYNERIAGVDEQPVSAVQNLLERIDERDHHLQGTLGLIHGRSSSGAASQIAEIGNQIHAERQVLSDLRQVLGTVAGNAAVSSLSLQAMVALVRAGVPAHVAVQGACRGLTANEIDVLWHQSVAQGVPLNDHTFPAAYLDGQVVAGTEKALGSGAVNTVSMASYRPLDGAGKPVVMVFKAEPQGDHHLGHKAGYTGIGTLPTLGPKTGKVQWGQGAQVPPNLSGRSLATARLNDRLGLTLVPPTEPALRHGRIGTVMGLAQGASPLTEGKVSLALDAELSGWMQDHPDMLNAYALANNYSGARLEGDKLVLLREEPALPGKPAQAKDIAVEVDFAAPAIRQQLTDLTWFDALCGQIDRHAHNYFVARGDNGDWSVTAIDNDFAFGRNASIGGEGCPSLPSVISKALADQLLGLTEAELRSLLAPLISDEKLEISVTLASGENKTAVLPSEVDATVARLRQIQEKLRSREVTVLDDIGSWGGDEVGGKLGIVPAAIDSMLTPGQRKQASDKGYAGRDSADQAEFRFQQGTPAQYAPLFNAERVRADLQAQREGATANASALPSTTSEASRANRQ